MKSHKIFFCCTFCFFSLVFAETNKELRQIRLQNFKNNYHGKIIRFNDSNTGKIKGTLLDVTETDFIISINNSTTHIKHKNIEHVFFDAGIKDFLIVFGVGSIASLSSYLALIILDENPKTTTQAAITTFGFFFGAYIGKLSFLVPIKINISGSIIN